MGAMFAAIARKMSLITPSTDLVIKGDKHFAKVVRAARMIALQAGFADLARVYQKVFKP